MDKCTTIQLLRKPKILDMSIFDWLTSLFGAFLLGKLVGINGIVHWLFFVLGWILFGIFAHWYYKIPTMLGYYLGINEKPVRKECS